jgi:hypothetical protein
MSATVSAALAPGKSISDLVLRLSMPKYLMILHYRFRGESRDFVESSSNNRLLLD